MNPLFKEMREPGLLFCPAWNSFVHREGLRGKIVRVVSRSTSSTVESSPASQLLTGLTISTDEPSEPIGDDDCVSLIVNNMTKWEGSTAAVIQACTRIPEVLGRAFRHEGIGIEDRVKLATFTALLPHPIPLAPDAVVTLHREAKAYPRIAVDLFLVVNMGNLAQ